jgi:hypothetical protein|nr:MAG TPA: Repressor protein CI [Caudoviricetes sp.]
MNVGARIKIRRKEINMKAYELASKINVSLSTLYRYEKGDIEKMSTDVLKEIADALSTTPADLMGWDETEETILSKITTAASKLEEERQEKVLGYCEDQLSEQEKGSRELPTVDERFTNVTDIYRKLSPERQEEARRSMNRQLRSQNIVKMEEIQKAQDLYESLGEEFEDIGLYGEVSAGTGVWVSDEPIADKNTTIKSIKINCLSYFIGFF